MALTSNLKRTGRAARTDQTDQANYVLEVTSARRVLTDLVAEIAQDNVLAEIWDSGLVPECTTLAKHVKVARMLLQHKGVVPQWLPLPNVGR